MPILSSANRQFASKHWTKATEKPGGMKQKDKN